MEVPQGEHFPKSILIFWKTHQLWLDRSEKLSAVVQRTDLHVFNNNLWSGIILSRTPGPGLSSTLPAPDISQHI